MPNGNAVLVLLGTLSAAGLAAAWLAEDVRWLLAVIVFLLAGNLWVGFKNARDVGGINAVLCGDPRHGTRGLIATVLDERTGLKKRLDDHEDVLRAVVEHSEALVSAAADTHNHEDFRQRMQVVAEAQEKTHRGLRRRIKGLTLTPFRPAED